MYSRAKERLEYLSSIEKGWLDEHGSGEEIPQAIIDRASSLLEKLDFNNIIEPLLFPTEEGYVLIEWHLPQGITTIDVEPSTYYLFSLDNKSDERYTHIPNVTDDQQVLDFIREKVVPYEH